ncbi:Longevity assurance proteins LAG1 LAC1 [Mycena venus]|uniref:Longevity assurance proteins LAG1 LAC1 n=1 Tax=Mycena venus TaxID=2733690 RepID=A0A8H6YVA6_9AGAR|nr:Longevity assurance proteins LAG1 LAC1 [Mycena venus]
MISTARPKPKTRIDDLAEPFTPDSPPAPPPPVTAPTPSSPACPKPSMGSSASMRPEDVSPWLRWAVSSASAARVLVLPPLFALPTHYLLPYLRPLLPSRLQSIGNPFTPFFLLSHLAPRPERVTASTTTEAFLDAGGKVYVKGLGDLLLVAYSIVLFSLLRLLFTHYAFPTLARRYGIRKPGKLERFGEQGYAVVYFAVFGIWGIYNMSTSRTWWFQTEYFWRDYPHNHLSGAMKRYYLFQIAYWLQQFLVLILGLEKRRSDHWELVIHHVITVWMVTWSYLMHVTLLGNAVFVSMDIPDVLLAVRSFVPPFLLHVAIFLLASNRRATMPSCRLCARLRHLLTSIFNRRTNPSRRTQFSKLLNYLQLERAKVVSFAVFVVGWTKVHQIFSPSTDIWMAPWMRDQMFYTLCILQVLNLFWYWLILRILYRTIMTAETDDNRSDAEEEEDEPVPLVVAPTEKGLGLGPSFAFVRDIDSEKQALSQPTPSKSGRSKSGSTRGAASRAGGAHGLSAVGNT